MKTNVTKVKEAPNGFTMYEREKYNKARHRGKAPWPRYFINNPVTQDYFKEFNRISQANDAFAILSELKTAKATTTYIKKSWTDDTGGGVMVDYVELHNGVILSITDESVQAYRNIEEVEDSADNFASMEIIPMPELSGEGVDTTIVDHMEKREREREAIFLAKCNDGGGRKPSQLPESHIREHWDLEESGDNGESLEDWLETCDVGDSWVNGTDELERIS